MPFRILLLVLLLGSCIGHPALAQTTADEETAEAELAQRRAEARERLAEIQQTIFSRREELVSLQQQLEVAPEEEKAVLQERIDRLSTAIAELNESFEQILIGGIDTDALGSAEEQPFDWRVELEQITRPLLNSLSDLTEKPRRIEALRANIQRLEEQEAVASRGVESLEGFQDDELAEPVRTRYEAVRAEWAERLADIRRSLELARFQLANLRGQNVSWQESLGNSLESFTEGRGLTLLLGIAAAVVVWVLLKVLLLAIQKLGKHGDRQHNMRVRLVTYSFRVITTALVIMALLVVFYVRGDLLLTALVIIGLAALALSLRQTVPRYMAEVRLLLGVGPVRHGERVIYNGLPMRVRSINMYSVLHNPALEGVVRLPLLALNDLVSRPAHSDEVWFPCKSGDYVLLPEGGFGLVVRQTLETVELKMLGSPILFSSADFFAMNVRNLSKAGFGVAVTFGIDYRHQGICLDGVPGRFEAAVDRALKAQDWGEHVTGLLVDFKEAGANSLDYLIFVSMAGAAAGSYFAVGRVVQKACVAVCNDEGWGIPFAQLTVHQGEGFDAMREVRQRQPSLEPSLGR